MSSSSAIPITLLTGFLGSGNTTLLSRLVRQVPLTAVVMNEFGQVALDHRILREFDAPLALLSGGCVCCQVQGSLGPTLRNLWLGRGDGTLPAFKRVVIVTTGIAEPAPIVETLLRDRWVARRYALDAVITTVDAVLAEQQLDSHFEAVRQVAVADRLLLTKVDLAGPEAALAVRHRLSRLNPTAPILEVPHGEIAPEQVLDLGVFRPDARHGRISDWLGVSCFEPIAPKLTGLSRRPEAAATPHDQRIRGFSFSIEQPMDWSGIADAVASLIEFAGARLLRMKAIVNVVGQSQPVILHAVQHILHPPQTLEAWPDTDRASHFVFITADLDADFVAGLLGEFALAARSNPGVPTSGQTVVIKESDS
ncbi:MAG: CobW family GTP-binding protein [Thiotrichales bacterium]